MFNSNEFKIPSKYSSHFMFLFFLNTELVFLAFLINISCIQVQHNIIKINKPIRSLWNHKITQHFTKSSVPIRKTDYLLLSLASVQLLSARYKFYYSESSTLWSNPERSADCRCPFITAYSINARWQNTYWSGIWME